ncbi:MAG: hypothetical protein ACREJT_13915, partial [Myxococcota bacterium]
MTRRNRSKLASSVLGLALVFALFSTSALAASNDKAKSKSTGISKAVAEKLMTAYELLQADKFDASLAIVDELADRRKLRPPEIAPIHRFRGYIFVNKGMTEQAAAEFEKSLAQKALDPTAEQVMMYS